MKNDAAGARFRIIDAKGHEVLYGDLPAVVDAIRSREITVDTLLFDSASQRWAKAIEHDAVQAALIAFDRAARSMHESSTSQPQVPAARARTTGAQLGENQHEDETLRRLKLYIGANWEEHYERPFIRLLRAQRSGGGAGWTWNWAAAIVPIWFLYRRQYLAFVGFALLSGLIDALDQAVAGSAEGGSAFALLFVFQFVLQGVLADRLLFRKALAIVKDGRRTDAAVRAAGKPHVWIPWVFLTIVLLGIAAAIVIPNVLR